MKNEIQVQNNRNFLIRSGSSNIVQKHIHINVDAVIMSFVFTSIFLK